MALDALHDHVQRHQVASAAQHHDVRVFPGGLHIHLVHGLHGGEILLRHGLEGAPALLHVPQAAAEDALVRIRLHEDLDIEHIPQGGILKDQDALHHDDPGGEDLHRPVGAVVVRVGVDRALDGPARLQLLQVPDQQIGVEGVGVVVVDSGPLLEGPALLTLVVAVVADDGDRIAEVLLQMPRQGGLAGAGAARDADQHGVHGPVPLSGGRAEAGRPSS